MENRAPVYWSNYTGPLPFAAVGAADDAGQGGGNRPRRARPGTRSRRLDGRPSPCRSRWPYGPTQMPPMPMTDEEREALVKYLGPAGPVRE